MTPHFAPLSRQSITPALVWLLLAAPALAQTPRQATPGIEPGASLKPSQSLQSAVEPANVLQRAVANAGVKTCQSAVRALGTALTGPENSYAVALMTNTAAPDTSAFSASIERAEPNGTRFVSANFSPTPKGGCDASYEMVDTWAKSCNDVAVQELKYAQRLNIIGRDIQVIPYSPTHHVYLIKTASGCISISKEVLYR